MKSEEKNTEAIKQILDIIGQECESTTDSLAVIGEVACRVLVSMCKYYDESIESHTAAVSLIDDIEFSVKNHINKHLNRDEQDKEYKEERFANIFNYSKFKTEEDGDSEGRVAACKEIMSSDNIGYILLALTKNEELREYCNIPDRTFRAILYRLVRTILYEQEIINNEMNGA